MLKATHKDPGGHKGLKQPTAKDGKGNIIDTSRLPRRSVLLNVYDVGESSAIRKVNGFGIGGGVYHGGVEVYGVEWSYGFTQTSGTGVSMCKPRAHPMHAYRQTVEMGQTRCTEEQASDIVQELLDQWDGRDYHLLKHNCLDFCNALLKKLGLGPIPAWVDRYGRAAESVGKVMYTPISAAKIAGDYGRRLAGVKRTSKDCPPADSPNFNGEDMYARFEDFDGFMTSSKAIRPRQDIYDDSFDDFGPDSIVAANAIKPQRLLDQSRTEAPRKALCSADTVDLANLLASQPQQTRPRRSRSAEPQSANPTIDSVEAGKRPGSVKAKQDSAGAKQRQKLQERDKTDTDEASGVVKKGSKDAKDSRQPSRSESQLDQADAAKKQNDAARPKAKGKARQRDNVKESAVADGLTEGRGDVPPGENKERKTKAAKTDRSKRQPAEADTRPKKQEKPLDPAATQTEDSADTYPPPFRPPPLPPPAEPPPLVERSHDDGVEPVFPEIVPSRPLQLLHKAVNDDSKQTLLDSEASTAPSLASEMRALVGHAALPPTAIARRCGPVDALDSPPLKGVKVRMRL